MAVGLAEVFRNGTFEEKQEALQESSSNLTIIGKITTISEGKELKIIKNMLLGVKKENPDFEPKNWGNSPNKTSKNGAFDPVSDELLAWRDAFRNYDWERAFPSPEATIGHVKHLLALVQVYPTPQLNIS